MKERPILFSGEMVRAILNGTKTQTRRVVKWRKSLPDGGGFDCVQNLRTGGWVPMIEGRLQWSPYGGAPYQDYPFVAECCPYGVPGDRLWVRETWSEDALRMYPCPRVWYRATDSIDRNDGHTCPEGRRGKWADCLACWEESVGRKFQWKPSIFMKRHDSRITLQIVSVRVERLGEICRKDAIAEGFPYTAMLSRAVDPWHPNEPFAWYADLWEKINGAGSWAVNPWVWVVEFKRVDGGSFVR